MNGLRIDKWLWAARFFKTRALAQDAIELGRVRLSGERIKASREVRVNDRLEILRAEERFEVVVQGLSAQRGPASVAQALYLETEASRIARAVQAEQRRLLAEPASDIKGRPTKREGRDLRRWRES
ncbi:MAG: RNA-binding S4 domain-containing protein [Burkholderiaceae bacterium]